MTAKTTPTGPQTLPAVTDATADDKMRREHKGLVRSAAAAMLTVLAMLTLLTTPASASVTYYGAQARVSVASTTGSHQFTVYPSTTPMTNWDAGQWVAYQVWARDVTSSTPGAWKAFAWQGPFQVTRSSEQTCTMQWNECTYTVQDTSRTKLGDGFTVTGYAGHRYQVTARLGYWMGSAYSYVDVPMDDCYNSYVWQGQTSTSRGASCAT